MRVNPFHRRLRTFTVLDSNFWRCNLRRQTHVCCNRTGRTSLHTLNLHRVSMCLSAAHDFYYPAAVGSTRSFRFSWCANRPGRR